MNGQNQFNFSKKQYLLVNEQSRTLKLACGLLLIFFMGIFSIYLTIYLATYTVFAQSTISDGFDYPVGSYGTYGRCPNSTSSTNCYWLAAGFLDTSYNGTPHLGEDWNRGAGSTD